MLTDDMQDQQDTEHEAAAPRAIVHDLAALDLQSGSDGGTEVHLEHPVTGLPLYDATDQPIFIAVLGEDSKKVRAQDRKANDRRTDMLRKNRGNALDTESSERDAVERLVAATLRWNLMPLDGKALPCTPLNARRVYSDPRFPWIAEQIDKAMKDKKRFFSPESTP